MAKKKATVKKASAKKPARPASKPTKAAARKTAKRTAKKPAKKRAPSGAKKKPAPRTPTLHGVFDAIAAFEAHIQKGAFARKEDMLRLASDSKEQWRTFCLDLQSSGDCPNPTSDFCEPPPTA
jgi:hypothetical protein